MLAARYFEISEQGCVESDAGTAARVEHLEMIEEDSPCAPRSCAEIPRPHPLGNPETWKKGNMRNIKGSGVLFAVERSPAIKELIEVISLMLAYSPGEGPATISCCGDVVRVEIASSPRAPTVATRIADHQPLREWFSDMCAAGYSAQPSDGAGSTSIDRRAQLRARLLDEGLGELIVADLGFSGGLIHDLSEGGMSLQLAGPMPPVPEFNVHFKLGYGASAIDAKARPVWRGGEGRIGICFAELSEEARDQLTHWLNGKRDIVQRETMTGEESAVAAPTATLDDPSDRTEEKDRSLVSKLARAYSALSSQQHAAALVPVGDGPFPNPRAGSALETAPEAESPERDEASFEVLRKASEREVRREKALDVVTGKRGAARAP